MRALHNNSIQYFQKNKSKRTVVFRLTPQKQIFNEPLLGISAAVRLLGHPAYLGQTARTLVRALRMHTQWMHCAACGLSLSLYYTATSACALMARSPRPMRKRESGGRFLTPPKNGPSKRQQTSGAGDRHRSAGIRDFEVGSGEPSETGRHWLGYDEKW